MPPILFKLVENRRTPRFLGVGPSLDGMDPLPSVILRIFGVTKDSGGLILANCIVTLYQTADDKPVDKTLSDANGYYEFRSASLATAYYVVAYKAGVPDVAGTTINTLVGNA